MRDPENFWENFQAAKLVLVSIDGVKVRKAYRSQASLFKKHTMQTILLKQTDSEINFDVVDNKKRNGMIRRLIYSGF